MTFEHTEIFHSKPSGLTDPLRVAGAVIVHKTEFLLLKRHPDKPYGSHWNLPAGKIEFNEDPQKGAQREIFEETGILIPLPALKPLKIFYIKRGSLFIEFHVFKTEYELKPDVFLKLDENTDSVWMSLEQTSDINLLGGGKEILYFALGKPAL